jgi:predicted nucleic acid-binding protein
MAVKLRAVIDTNVLFEGITQRGGACGLLVDAWLAGLFRPYVSDSLCYEYLMCLRASFPQDDSLKLFIWSMNS